MTSRLNESSGSTSNSRSNPRYNSVAMTSQSEEEGCPVVDESGTVCGENRSLSVFQEFRQIYDDCIQKMEANEDDNSALRKLAPFRKLVEDLWEQNSMLVETVEELEHEATCRIAMLQDKLDECSGKDPQSLLKEKDREICCLSKELSGKDELLGKYYVQIDELRRDMKSRSRKYQRVLNRLKDAVVKRLSRFNMIDSGFECDEFSECHVKKIKRRRPGKAMEELFNVLLKELDNQKARFTNQMEESASQISELSSERDMMKAEMSKRVSDLESENREQESELSRVRAEKEDLACRLEQVKGERDRLLEKVNALHQNIQELNTSFKGTRWALTAEVAEKHDQILELRRSMAVLEEHARRADMNTQFKDDIIKEMRKELKSNAKRTTICTLENITKVPVEVPSLLKSQQWSFDTPVREGDKDDLILDIHIFPIIEAESPCLPNVTSVEVQTETKKTKTKTRNVSTQHTTRVQKLPRSFGTLTVAPWSGEGLICNVDSQYLKDTRNNMQSIYTVPCSTF